jgi:type II secretory pathway component PulM
MKGFWNRLGARQKKTVIAGAAVVALIIFMQFALVPFIDGKKKMKRSLALNEATLKEMYRLEAEYSSIRQGESVIQAALSRRAPDFSLFSFVEKKAAEAGLKGNMRSLQPSRPAPAGRFEEVAAEIRLEKVTLKQVVDFLAAAESVEQAVILKRISVSRSPESPEYLSAQIQLVTFQNQPGVSVPPAGPRELDGRPRKKMGSV